jgi:flagellar biosynthesis protein FlhF
MRIKSYFAGSVQEAIESARAELGSDAMLLHSKKTEWELRSLGAYEVVFGVAAEPGASTGLSPVAETAAVAGILEPSDELVRSSDVVKELADLRKQIETVRRSVVRHSVVRNGSTVAPSGSVQTEEICASLVAADFSEEFAGEIAEAVEARVGGSSHLGRTAPDGRYEAALASELERRLRVEPRIAGDAGEARRVLFAGPAGAGKTTSLIKLAIRCSLDERVPVQLLSLDTLRVGGWEQLAAYARIAGLPFDVVHNTGLLNEALEEYRGKKLILIDSPGFSPAELDDMPELPSGLEVQLVLPATLTARAAGRAVERFAAFRPAKLLFTHVDEMETPGALLEAAMRSGLPVSFLADGRQIPEDIREASKAELLAPFEARDRQQIAASAA